MREDYISFRELYHSGIQGMKWGIRRYQNDDGTLTEAGKARYNADGSKKTPNNMSLEELNKANQQINAENTYRNLTGTTQPGKALNRDTAIKLGAAFVASSASTFLLRGFKTGNMMPTGEHSKRKALTTALLAGGIGTVLAAANSLGSSVYTENEKEEKKKKVTQEAAKIVA